MRTFIAIELPTKTIQAVEALQEQLIAQVIPQTVRWTVMQNVHLTLHFLGNVPDKKINKISQSIYYSIKNSPPFTLNLAGLGCFPNFNKPRIVWVDIRGDVQQLQTIQKELGQQLKRNIDFTPEARRYTPHLTIGRIKKDIPASRISRLGEQLQQIKVPTIAPLPVTNISVMESQLTPNGPVYTQVAQVPIQ